MHFNLVIDPPQFKSVSQVKSVQAFTAMTVYHCHHLNKQRWYGPELSCQCWIDLVHWLDLGHFLMLTGKVCYPGTLLYKGLLFFSCPMTFHGTFYYQGLQDSRAWVVVHRSRQTWEFDTTLWPTNHFLTSSNVALHFNRKEINRPNLYNLWTQSKSWLDSLLKMGIPVRLGECFIEQN